jgi:hypothetical protein
MTSVDDDIHLIALQHSVSGQREYVYGSVIYRVSEDWVAEYIRSLPEHHTVHNPNELEAVLVENKYTVIFIPAKASMTTSHLKMLLTEFTPPKIVFWGTEGEY